MIIRKLLIVSIAGAGIVLLPSAAHASCAGPVPMREAIVGSSATFVGIVSAVENYRRWATVDVTEVWKGNVDQAQVTVKGGPKDPAGGSHVVTTVDRSYRLGRTYLFVVHDGNGSVFRDNICSRTTAFRAELERFRPVSTTASPSPQPTPEEQPEDGGGIDNTVVLGTTAALLVAAALWLIRRKGD